MSRSASENAVAERSASQRVIEAVAETTGNDPTEVGPLYHVVDPDALDHLFASTPGSGRTGGRIEFTFAGCDVVVGADGSVEVSEREAVGNTSDAAGTGAARVGTGHDGL